MFLGLMPRAQSLTQPYFSLCLQAISPHLGPRRSTWYQREWYSDRQSGKHVLC